MKRGNWKRMFKLPCQPSASNHRLQSTGDARE